MYDVVALGESLIDLTQAGRNEQGIELLARNPGGAPTNCLAMHAKLGGNVALIGMVGDDVFGHYLVSNMQEGGIDTKGVLLSEQYPTTLAVVQLDERGEKTYSFYRSPSADMMLSWDMVDKSLIDDCKIFHFGGVSLTDGPCVQATLEAAKYARSKGKLVSYDPNYREPLWKDKQYARYELTAAIPMCDILKVNEEELLLLTGTDDPIAGGKLLKAMGPSVVLITLGGDGACYVNDVCSGRVESFKVVVRDTTGAGDAFTGALHSLVRDMSAEELSVLDGVTLENYVRFASAAGALTTTKLGAIPALPTIVDIQACLT